MAILSPCSSKGCFLWTEHSAPVVPHLAYAGAWVWPGALATEAWTGGHEQETGFNQASGTTECLYGLDSMVHQKAGTILGVVPSSVCPGVKPPHLTCVEHRLLWAMKADKKKSSRPCQGKNIELLFSLRWLFFNRITDLTIPWTQAAPDSWWCFRKYRYGKGVGNQLARAVFLLKSELLWPS